MIKDLIKLIDDGATAEDIKRSAINRLSINSALNFASYNGKLKHVKVLLEVGANVHGHNDYSLRWASSGGYVEIVKVLLEAGANVHAKDDQALYWTVRNKHLETIRILLGAGADRTRVENFEEKLLEMI